MWARSDSQLAQPLMLLLCAHGCCHIRAGAAIAEEGAFWVIVRLAAGFYIHHRAVGQCGRVDEIAERLTGLKHRPMKSPLLWLRFDVQREIPPGQPNPAHRLEAESAKSVAFREPCEFVVGIGLPKPIGGGFGVLAELLFALPQCLLGALAFIDIDRHAVPLDDPPLSVAQRLTANMVPTIFAVRRPQAVHR